jgi:uncharacterized protein (DUF885 family)
VAGSSQLRAQADQLTQTNLPDVSAAAAAAGRVGTEPPRIDPLAAVPELDALIGRPQSEMRDVVERFTADRRALERRYDAPGSPDQRRRMRAFYEAWLTRLAEVDFAGLGQEGRIDYLRLKALAKHELTLLDRSEREARESAALVPFADTLLGLPDARRRLETVDGRAVANLLARVTAMADSLRESLDALAKGDAAAAAKTAARNGDARRDTAKPKISKIVAYHAARRVEALRKQTEEWFKYYDGYDPVFSWWVREPYRHFNESMQKYTKALREKIVGWKEGEDEPIVGLPIGEDGLMEDLRYEMIPYTPDELIAIARREHAWSLNEMKKAAREMGFGDDWKAAMEKVKETYVEPGRQPDLIRNLARQAEAFFDAHDWVTIPPLAREDWRMEMMSPERQKVSPFFLGGEQIIVSYPTDGMKDDEKLMSMRGNNPHFSHATVFHELNPGHHLQQFMMQRYNSHRAAFRTPFWNEGQSLYWEMFLWERGFHSTPEDKIGALFWRLHRSARIIFSLSFHMGRMTPEEAIDFLVDSVGFERYNAEGEVRRSFNGSYSPLYQAAYMLGGLQLRALYRELVIPGHMTEREFHDAVLQGGPMPIEMVRARLLNVRLTENYESQWKFAGPDPIREGRATGEESGG